MNKLIFFVLVLFGTLSYSVAQVVYIPDIKFKKALVSNTEINTNGDFEIQLSEAVAYQGEININNLGINDMTGIEAFTNITILRCSYNNFSHLDVSKNTKLIKLFCTNGYSIESLILGTLLDLEYLFCYGQKIKDLDVSNLNKLSIIRCGNNNLIYMDLSSNPNLTTVDIRSCDLLKLDMRNGNNTNITFFYLLDNPRLTCINVSDVAFAYANWTFIDPEVEFSTNCEPYRIAFHITNHLGFPIKDAEIKITILDETIEYTDANGNVVFNYVGPGTYLYRADAEGYKGIYGYVEVIDDNINLDYCLKIGETDVVEIPDNNFLNALISNPQINTNSDNFIQVTEAFYYTGEIEVPNIKIRSLDGIESFNNITGLDCSFNFITNLNLNNNTKLKYVTTSHNYGLQTLKLGKLHQLKHLYCPENNLNSLDNKYLYSLKILLASGNDFQSVDLTTNSNLEIVHLFNCNLNSLDLRNGNNSQLLELFTFNNSDLSCVSVDDTCFANANWTNDNPGIDFLLDCGKSFIVDKINLKTTSYEDENIQGTLHQSNTKTSLIDVQGASGFRIIPNPAKDYFFLEGECLPDKLVLLNAQGSVIEYLDPKSKDINISNLTPGIYFIEMVIRNKIELIKFIKM